MASHLAGHSTDICSQWTDHCAGHWDTVVEKTDMVSPLTKPHDRGSCK